MSTFDSLPTVLQEQIAAEVWEHGSLHAASLGACSREWKAWHSKYSKVCTVSAKQIDTAASMLNSIQRLENLRIVHKTMPVVTVSSTALSSLQARLKKLMLGSGDCVMTHNMQETSDGEEADGERDIKRIATSSCIFVQNLASFLQPWFNTLDHLQLDHCHISGLERNAVFSLIPCLQTLSLISVCANTNTLRLSGCNALKFLHCSGNVFTTLDLGGCGALEALHCKSGDLCELTLRGCCSMILLDCRCNRFKILSLNHCQRLKQLLCSGNQLDRLFLPPSLRLDLFSYSGVGYYYPENESGDSPVPTGNVYRQVPQLPVTSILGIAVISELRCSPVALQSIQGLQRQLLLRLQLKSVCVASSEYIFKDKDMQLDLTGFTSLQELHFIIHTQASLNLSGLSAPRKLKISNFMGESSCLASINVSRCFFLEELVCNNFPRLTSLCLDQCTQLKTLECRGSNLGELDVSSCPFLTSLDVSQSMRLKVIHTNNAIHQLSIKIKDCGKLLVTSRMRYVETLSPESNNGDVTTLSIQASTLPAARIAPQRNRFTAKLHSFRSHWLRWIKKIGAASVCVIPALITYKYS